MTAKLLRLNAAERAIERNALQRPARRRLVQVSQPLQLAGDFFIGFGLFERGQLLFENMLHKLVRGAVPARLGAFFDFGVQSLIQLDCGGHGVFSLALSDGARFFHFAARPGAAGATAPLQGHPEALLQQQRRQHRDYDKPDQPVHANAQPAEAGVGVADLHPVDCGRGNAGFIGMPHRLL